MMFSFSGPVLAAKFASLQESLDVISGIAHCTLEIVSNCSVESITLITIITLITLITVTSLINPVILMLLATLRNLITVISLITLNNPK